MDPPLLPFPHRTVEHRLRRAVPGRGPTHPGPHSFHLSFFFLSLSKFRTFSDGLTGEIEESLARVVSDASYCPAQAFGCFAPYIKLNSMKIRCYDVVLAKQSGLTVFVKRQMVEFVGSLYPLSLIIS